MNVIGSCRTPCFILSLLRFGQAIFFGYLVLIFVLFILVVFFRIAEVGGDEGFVFFGNLFRRLRLFHFMNFFAVELQQFNDRRYLFSTQAWLALPFSMKGMTSGTKPTKHSSLGFLSLISATVGNATMG